MTGTRRALGALPVLALLATGCAVEPTEAVIALHGTTADEAYYESIRDSLAALPIPIRLEIFNTAGGPAGWTNAFDVAQNLVLIPGLVGVVGHRNSRSTLAVGPVYRDAGLPLIVPNATSGEIAKLGPSVFRLVPDDAAQGKFMTQLAVERLGAESLVIYHVTDEYGAGLSDGVLTAAREAGIDDVDVVEYGSGALCPSEFRPLVEASLQRLVPDVAILAGRVPDSGCIARLLHERAPSVRMIGADGVETSQEFVADLGPAADSMWFVRFWARDETNARSTAFLDTYAALGGRPPDSGAILRWDGVNLLIAAVEEVGVNPTRVAEWLLDLRGNRPPMPGLSGPLSFGPEADRPLLVFDARGRPVPMGVR